MLLDFPRRVFVSMPATAFSINRCFVFSGSFLVIMLFKAATSQPKRQASQTKWHTFQGNPERGFRATALDKTVVRLESSGLLALNIGKITLSCPKDPTNMRDTSLVHHLEDLGRLVSRIQLPAILVLRIWPFGHKGAGSRKSSSHAPGVVYTMLESSESGRPAKRVPC